MQVAKYGTVAIITKAKADEGCTALAQGGISAVLDEMGDSVDLHIQDTMQAGEFLNSRRYVPLSQIRKAVTTFLSVPVSFAFFSVFLELLFFCQPPLNGISAHPSSC